MGYAVEDRDVKKVDRARFNRLVMQRELEHEILRRRQQRAEADGQKSDGENKLDAE